ncbi:MAG TPA: phage tail sheath C-terminal domain-containing protein [Candidatus Limnocylindrales bacterium]|nr:phage tail sheath C-terminal domain-containing protein [Candidatus Limnocylindrales bacterium]
MAEVITETILPGTYIEVRAEGLLTIGAIATGNVGIIGTAEMGSSKIENLSSFEEGRARFGEIEEWDLKGGESNLTLVRALKFLFDNGARTVYAQRVLDEKTARGATYQISNESNAPVLTLKARTPGTWGNRLQIRIEEAEVQELVSKEVVARSNGSFVLSAQKILQPQAAEGGNGAESSIGSVVVLEQGLAKKYQLKQTQASTSVVQVNPTNRTLTFAIPPSSTAEVLASYWVPKESLRKVTLRYGNTQEVYIVPSISYLAQRLKDEENPSRLVEVVETKGDGLPKTTPRFEAFSGGENGTVSLSHFQAALDNLVEQNVQIVVVAGLKFSDIKAAILGHVEKTENLGRERMAVVGTDSSEMEKILENANEIADKRIVLVAPGLREKDPQTGQVVDLPPYFAAAAVAGKLSSLSPHISLTNKTLAGIEDLAMEYNYGELKALVQNRVLTLQKKRGIRVVKGITTDDEAFKQITLRRIVDYVKEGTRLGANQYIGKLNNRRVRENLRTTLDSFLSDLILREFLTGYKLTVSADRAMEIRGEVLVVMDLNPTFSIDVIRVIMNLS